jgi:IS4 transposase
MDQETSAEVLDLYADYLISSFRATTATGLATLLDGALSHDQVTRFLAAEARTSVDLWRVVKPLVRAVQSPAGVLIIDDSIEEKPYTDENEIIAWHWDHSKERAVKGLNFLTALYQVQDLSLPVAFEFVRKTATVLDPKTGKLKRKSPTTKNESYRTMLRQCVRNGVEFRYVLNDVWYASAENMKFIKQELGQVGKAGTADKEFDFVMPLKANRKVALSRPEKQQGRYVRVETLALEKDTVREVYLEGVDFPLLLVKQVFTNGDGSQGVLYLVSSDTTLTYEAITTLYHKRWKVEEYHKSLKQNASLAKSPTRTVTTQTNHFFAALYAYIKLERLKLKTALNHFALKTKIYVSALHTAFQELQALQVDSSAAA